MAKNEAFVFSTDCPLQDLGEGVKRRVLSYSDELMLVEVHFEKGARGSLHTHPHAQMTYVLEGVFEFTIDGIVKIVKKGDTLYDCPDVSHGCLCLEKGILLDVFHPYRADFVK